MLLSTLVFFLLQNDCIPIATPRHDFFAVINIITHYSN